MVDLGIIISSDDFAEAIKEPQLSKNGLFTKVIHSKDADYI